MPEADNFRAKEKRIDEGQGGIVALVVSFALEMKGLTEGFMTMNLDYGSMQANGVIHGGRSPGAGSDGMAAMVLLFLYYRQMFG